MTELDHSAAPPGFAPSAVPAPAAPRVRPSRELSLPTPSKRVLIYLLLFAALGAGAYVVLTRHPSDTSQVRKVIAQYNVAVRDGQTIQACSLLTPESQKVMVAKAKAAGIGSTCLSLISFAGAYERALIAQVPADRQAELNGLFDTSHLPVSIAGDHATAIPFDTPMTLVREHGHWLIQMDIPNLGAKPATPHSYPATAKGRFAAQADAVCKAPDAEAKKLTVPLAIAALTDRTPPADTTHRLQRTGFLAEKEMRLLRQLHPPAAQAAAFRGYLAAEASDAAAIERSAELAETGEADAALAPFRQGDTQTDPTTRYAKALGFQVCS